MTKAAVYGFEAEVFDGLGIAHIVKVERRKYAADIPVEVVGTVYGVHTKAEAIEEAKREGMI